MSCGPSGRDDSSQKNGKLTPKNFRVYMLQGGATWLEPSDKGGESWREIRQQGTSVPYRPGLDIVASM